MSFEIHATDNGPVINYNGKIIVLISEDDMLDMCHEDPLRFKQLQDHIHDELKAAAETYLDGFSNGFNPPAQRLYSYIAALQQYWMFRNIKFAQYLEALRETDEANDDE
ncbi:MAG: hypothetical protein EB023_11860 [Flavobacteriia bacterium]|nr:hypothetical protein [Flavobacteriia bacterium]